MLLALLPPLGRGHVSSWAALAPAASPLPPTAVHTVCGNKIQFLDSMSDIQYSVLKLLLNLEEINVALGYYKIFSLPLTSSCRCTSPHFSCIFFPLRSHIFSNFSAAEEFSPFTASTIASSNLYMRHTHNVNVIIQGRDSNQTHSLHQTRELTQREAVSAEWLLFPEMNTATPGKHRTQILSSSFVTAQGFHLKCLYTCKYRILSWFFFLLGCV